MSINYSSPICYGLLQKLDLTDHIYYNLVNQLTELRRLWYVYTSKTARKFKKTNHS